MVCRLSFDAWFCQKSNTLDILSIHAHQGQHPIMHVTTFSNTIYRRWPMNSALPFALLIIRLIHPSTILAQRAPDTSSSPMWLALARALCSKPLKLHGTLSIRPRLRLVYTFLLPFLTGSLKPNAKSVLTSKRICLFGLMTTCPNGTMLLFPTILKFRLLFNSHSLVDKKMV